VADKIVELLQDILIDEHTASLLYATFSAILANDEINGLAKHFKTESKEESIHAKEIRDRLLILGEYPAIGVGKEKIDTDASSMMSHVKTLESNAVDKYNKLYSLAISSGDSVTAELAKDHAVDEESHREFAKAQLKLVEEIGDSLWLQKWL
jgi:bacterioferritin (cytochrome b1)